MDDPVHSVRQSSYKTKVQNWCEATLYLVPYNVVALMVCACCKSLACPQQRTLYKALLGCTAFGHLFLGLAQPFWEVAVILICSMIAFIVTVRVALQQQQQQQQQQHKAYPSTSKSRILSRVNRKRPRRKVTRVIFDDEIGSDVTDSDSLSSVSRKSSPLMDPTQQLVSRLPHRSVLKDVCPAYCERRAKAVPQVLRLRSKHSSISQASTPSVLSPIDSEESSVSDHAFLEDEM